MNNIPITPENEFPLALYWELLKDTIKETAALRREVAILQAKSAESAEQLRKEIVALKGEK